MAYTWTDNQTAISSRVLARGSVKRAIIDLTSAYEGLLFLRVGRSGTTALSSTAGVAGVSIQVRRLFNGSSKKHPSSNFSRLTGTTAAAVGQINNASGYAAGTSTFVVDGSSLVPASGYEQYLCFWGTASDPSGLSDDSTLSNCEFAKWAKGTSTSLTIDSPTEFNRIDNEYVTTQADIFAPITLPGGHQWEVIFDYGDDTGGQNVAIEALYKTLTAIS
jgi:hypothetical protein